MRVRRVKVDSAELGSLDAIGWRDAKSETVLLVPTPPALQPTRYIATKWQDKPYGNIKSMVVKALHNAVDIAFRLEWEDRTKNDRRVDNTDFPDAAAMLFPLSDASPLIMGGEGAPVNLWYWRADHPTKARSDLASGIGTSRAVDGESISAQARHHDGRWSVILRRALRLDNVAEGAIQFSSGQAHRVTFAVWEGGNLERAGIKAFSPSWLDMILED